MDLITRGCFMVGGRVKVTGSVTGTSSLSVPAGVTSITFTGKGGAGVYQAAFQGWNLNGSVVTSIPFSSGIFNMPATGYLVVAGQAIMSFFGSITLSSTGYAIGNNIRGVTNGSTYEIYIPSSTLFVVGENTNATTTLISGAYGWNVGTGEVVGISPVYFYPPGTLTYTSTPAQYVTGPSTTASSGQSTNGTKTWASHAVVGNPAAYQQTMTLSGAAATISYSVASGTTLSYEYFL